MSPWARQRDEGCLSDLRLDRLLRGELGADASPPAQAHLDGCAACRERLAALQAHRAAFQAAPPPLVRPAPRRPWWRWRDRAPTLRRSIVAGAGALLAAAAALVLVYRGGEPAGTRVKGSTLGFYVLHEGKLRRGEAGEPVVPGDTLQVVYTSPTPFYGAILSLDGAGHASRYFPDGPRAAPLGPGAATAFPRSTVLDDVLGRETILALYCGEPVALAPIEALVTDPARAIAAAQAAGCRVERVEIDKRRPGAP